MRAGLLAQLYPNRETDHLKIARQQSLAQAGGLALSLFGQAQVGALLA